MAKRTVAILGGGNIGWAIAVGLERSGAIPASHVTITRRNLEALADRAAAEGFALTRDNAAAVARSEVVVLAVTPQQLDPLLDEIAGAVEPDRHAVVSVVSGVSIRQIVSRLGESVDVVRAMPNTAVSIRESMTCLASVDGATEALATAREIFDALGTTLVIKEELMSAATSLCACGIAFFLRAIRAASQGGIEIGFHANEAILMAAQTAKGAAALLTSSNDHPEGQIDKVTTPRGITITGLNEMEHRGFSSAMIKGITTSAEKATKLYVHSD
jgi:pyrroline-5-carboxylate reductase